MPSVMTRFDKNFPDPRLLALGVSDLQSKINIINEATVTYYTDNLPKTFTLDILKANLKRRVQHNGKQISCTGSNIYLLKG